MFSPSVRTSLLVGVVAAVLSACGGPGPAATGGPSPAEEDGSIPDAAGISLDQTGHAALRKLDAGLYAAVREAAADAREAGVEFKVTSGWRSKDYQRRLLDEAVIRYGSAEEARRLVSTPEKSAHVTGRAIDIGPTDAADWLIRHGADYGLCRRYANEMWHFELLTSPGGTCPRPLDDASG
ncbi:M15 family metallopeptidase [Saccharothrix sp. HUAS TT1]|uniref:M15 family metallopeptidase n=1 Tax=unclassified Saccharothrix TaxID=2593673 RepID=UPI00345C1131